MDFDLSDNLKHNILGRCEHPRYLRNKYTNQLVEVPCGKCNQCLLNKCNTNMLLCSIEEAYHQSCYFVTLTYNSESLPRFSAEIDDLSCNLLGEAREHQKFKFVCRTPRISDYGCILHEGLYDVEYIQSMINKCNTVDKTISYLYYRDIQLYVKRVRKQCSKISSSSLRYYAVGEYGPKTFRAHWHILFYFTDEQGELSSNFIQIADKCWPYGRTDISSSRHSTASYLAGYINSYACVPTLLQARQFKPRCFHSTHFGFAPFEEDTQKIYEDPVKYIDDKVFKLFSGNVNARYFNRVRCWLFPRCPRFSDTTIDTQLRYYTLISFLRYHLNMPDSRFYKFIEDCFFNKEYVNSCSYIVRVVRAHISYLFQTFSSTPELIADNDYFEQFVKRALYMSRHFVDFICKDFDFSIRLKQIHDFYDTFIQRQLSSWYNAMVEYCAKFPDDVDLSPFYYQGMLGVSDDEHDNLHPIVEQLRYELASEFHERVKHRQLNDANNIFIID